jgi:hypothetical protein
VTGFARVDSSLVSVSLGSDGERVSVVGQERPSGPDLPALVAFETRSVQAVATFEVTDPAYAAGPVALQPSLSACAGGLLAAGDEHPLRVHGVERVVGRAEVEPAIQRNLLDRDPHARELGDGVGQQRVLRGVPQPGCRGDDQPGGTGAGVLGDLRDLRDIPKLVGFAELALADRTRVGI